MILQNVTAASFSGGQPAWFMTRDPNDQTWWYVEVTPEDFHLLSPRDIPGLIPDEKQDAGPINSPGLEHDGGRPASSFRLNADPGFP